MKNNYDYKKVLNDFVKDKLKEENKEDIHGKLLDWFNSELKINQGTAELRYQTIDYQSVTQETKSLINDYLLIHINLPDSNIPIDFVKTFTNIK
jgi:hypothetical protein